MSSEEYSHATLTIPIIFYMVWTKRSELFTTDKRYSSLGLSLFITGLGCYFFSIQTQVNTLIFISFYITLLGSILYLLDFQAMKVLLTPLFLFMILIPFPEQLYIKLTFPLQLKVSQASEIILRFFDIPLLRLGNVMHIPEKSFEVVEACSGLRSMITLITLSVIVGFFMLNRVVDKIILFVASIPIAIFINIIRVTSMILLFHFFEVDFSAGILHQANGIVLFTISIAMLIGIQNLLIRWENK